MPDVPNNEGADQEAGAQGVKPLNTHDSSPHASDVLTSSQQSATPPDRSTSELATQTVSDRQNSVADRQFRWLPVLCSVLLILLAAVLLALFFWIKELDRTVSLRLQNALWEIPARVYARPLEIYAGRKLNPAQVIAEMQQLGFRKSLAEQPGSYSVVSDTSGAITRIDIHNRAFTYSDGPETARKIAVFFEGSQIKSLRSLSSDSTTPAILRLEPAIIGSIHALQHEDREPVSIDDLPDGFADALVAVEDRQFFSHHGFSLRGIARAAWVNLRTGRRTQGASTLTQQLAKNLFLSPEKTLQRKLTEVVMAILLEYRLSKDEILELFINEVFLAQQGNRAIHGFGLASRFFYDKPLRDTTKDEYALLIGMIKAPSAYNPERNPERSIQRRNVVISLMKQQQLIDEATSSELSARPITLAASKTNNIYGAYLDLVREQLLRDYPLDELQSRGLRIFTHLDPAIQQTAQQSLTSFIRKAAGQTPATQGAILVTDSSTGEVKAVVGGVDNRQGGFNRALDARRQVGSVMKPAVYLSALEKSSRYTLATLLDDAPVSLQMPNGSVWQPENFDKTSRGKTLAIDALADSLNLATVNLALEVGIKDVVNTIEKLGAADNLPELPSLALGAVELSPFNITQMYQTIAADGYNVPLRAISSVTDSNNELLSQYPISIEQKFDSESMYLLRYALTDVMLRGTGRRISDHLPREYYVAGKTGTSNEQRDSWFAGFADDYLAVVWLGNDEGHPIPYAGSTGALPVWGNLMREISRRPLQFQTSAAISYVSTDPVSGKRMPESCKSAYLLPYVSGTEPQESINCTTPARKTRLHRFGRWLENVLDLN